MSDRLSFTILKSEDWNDQLPQLLDADGAPIDLTGNTLRLYVRPTFDYASAIAIFSSPDEIVIDDAAGGWARIVRPRSALANLPAGTWDQFLVLEAGTTRRELCHGTITIRERALAA